MTAWQQACSPIRCAMRLARIGLLAISAMLGLLTAPAAMAVETKASAGRLHSGNGVAHGLALKSHVALVVDEVTGELLIAKNVDEVHAVASITKLMTALVILEARVPLSELVEIGSEDVDTARGTRSRLKLGAQLSRNDLLHLALMASENRAAHALGRSYPGGLAAFVESMNAKARELGMMRTRFVDPTGLSSANVATAADLARLVRESHRHALIRQYSTNASHEVTVGSRVLRFNNTNRLVASANWDIGVSKTGYINEAGKCLVMQAILQGRPMVIVLLDSWGKLTRIGDANRIKKWLASSAAQGRAGRGA